MIYPFGCFGGNRLHANTHTYKHIHCVALVHKYIINSERKNLMFLRQPNHNQLRKLKIVQKFLAYEQNMKSTISDLEYKA